MMSNYTMGPDGTLSKEGEPENDNPAWAGKVRTAKQGSMAPVTEAEGIKWMTGGTLSQRKEN